MSINTLPLVRSSRKPESSQEPEDALASRAGHRARHQVVAERFPFLRGLRAEATSQDGGDVKDVLY